MKKQIYVNVITITNKRNQLGVTNPYTDVKQKYQLHATSKTDAKISTPELSINDVDQNRKKRQRNVISYLTRVNELIAERFFNTNSPWPLHLVSTDIRRENVRLSQGNQRLEKKDGAQLD